MAAAAIVGTGLVAGVLVGGGSGSEGDGDGARTVQPGAPGEEGRELTDEDAAAIEAPQHTAADTTFMRDMIVHHQQALEMTAFVEGRTEREDLPLLAERITVSQEAEIEQMETWLTDRDEDVPDDADTADHQAHELMPGMATTEQLDQLEAATGAAFDRLFLDLMIAHHQGALTMVDGLYAASGGLEPAADAFAREAGADQSIEILRMQELLPSVG